MAGINIVLCIVSIICVFRSVTLQEFEGFIVDGETAEIEDFPHAAFLFVECTESGINQNRYFTCGSSILNQVMVLTAAHCLVNCVAKSTIITVHVANRKKKKGLAIKVSGFKTHEDYDAKTISNDIGLVKLANTLKFGKDVRRVAVMREPPYEERATVTGWGWLSVSIYCEITLN